MSNPRRFSIGRHGIGPDPAGHTRCFLIAEAGVNHNGDVGLAHQLIDTAVAAGADAIKFQTFKSELVISEAAPKAAYQRKATGSDQSQLEMIKALELSFDDFAALQAHCKESGIIFLSTPFDADSVEFLDRLGMPAFKIPSGEITNFELLSRIGHCAKPMILSTGMSTLAEVGDALAVLTRENDPGLAVLHCVSNYPADPADANLRAMETMHRAFERPIGWSDHTTGCDIAFAAVALGACIVEKHFTLDRSMRGPDHGASLDPIELAVLVRGIRRVEAALGDGTKQPCPSEADTRQVARRSLFLRRSMETGDAITREAIIAMRPGGGIAPNDLGQVLGRRLRRPLPAGAMIGWPDLA